MDLYTTQLYSIEMITEQHATVSSNNDSPLPQAAKNTVFRTYANYQGCIMG